jgi:L-amino acid N-acyltransferase YncA
MALLIRLAGEADAEQIASIYRPYVEQSRISFEEFAPDSAEIDGRILGYASTSPMRDRSAYRWSVETGIYLAPEAQGCGLGRKLLSAHLDLLERQGFVTIVAGIALPNEASVALHEKLGFTLSGIERGVGYKLGQWVDVGRWQKDLAPRKAVPEGPQPCAEVRHPGLEPGSAFSTAT